MIFVPASGAAQSVSQPLLTHRVFAGETLIRIAQRHRTTVEAIVQLNNLRDPNSIKVGQTLKIPSSIQTRPQALPPRALPPNSELILIDGKEYLLRATGGKATLEAWPGAKPPAPPASPLTSFPNILLITRENGFPLFALRPDLEKDAYYSTNGFIWGDTSAQTWSDITGQNKGTFFRPLTAKQLYGAALQWFEPLADNYREIIWTYTGSTTVGSNAYSAYKHFSWNDIVEFSVVDRSSFSFRSGGDGDWKASHQGAEGYLLVLVDGYPYWGDAVGQIPFAVDTFKDKLEGTGDKEKSIEAVIKAGLEHGDGSIIPSTENDPNKYDNFMILRGALWASENHTVTKKVEKWVFGWAHESFEVHYGFKDTTRLSMPISKSLLDKYGSWSKK